MAELDKATVLELVKLGRLNAGPQAVPGGNVPFVLVPDGCKVTALPDLLYNEHSERPERVRQTVQVFEPDSFLGYFEHFSDGASRVFADETSNTVTAVLDYHQSATGPRWGSHSLVLKLMPSVEWSAWLGKNSQNMTQQQFAEFLEQNSMDIIVPDPAAIIEVANELKATTEVEFASGQRMQDGRMRFKYSENTRTTCGAGEVAVPEQFVISIPAYVGGQRVNLNALLRFRVKETKLSFFYTLIRPHEVQREAFMAARASIQARIDTAIINGKVL